MNNSNVHIAGLALATLGNIASAEMARDLSFEVEKLLTSNVTHLRKKVLYLLLQPMEDTDGRGSVADDRCGSNRQRFVRYVS